MKTAYRMIAVVVVAWAAACLPSIPNPQYDPCFSDPAGCRHADASTPIDAALDAAMDASAVPQPDLLMPDLLMPDLKPMCVTATDCTVATMPICGANQACRACAQNSECPSLVCNDDGSCEPAANVVYVDNQSGVCSGVHAGTMADPDCDINTALMTNGVAIVHVAGNIVGYAPLNITMPMTVRIVGPGATAMPTAKIAGNGGQAVNLSLNSGTTSITFDGFELRGDASAGSDAVDCAETNSSVTLTIRRSLVDDAKFVGISSSHCTLNVIQSTITGNAGGGVALKSGTVYNLENNFIFGNTGAAGVTISGGSTGIFTFNTVAFNGSLGQTASGVVCDASATDVLQNSIVWGNSSKAGAQFTTAGQCQMINVVAGVGETYAGAVTKDPDFASATVPYDVHLLKNDANNMACCVDKITPPDAGAAGLPTVDHDGNHRPRGNGRDIGAHEVQ